MSIFFSLLLSVLISNAELSSITTTVSAKQSGTWNVGVSSLSGTLGVTQGTSPWVTSRNWLLTSSDIVNIGNFPATQPVSGTFWQATQPVSGTFWQATQPVSGTFFQATQPVSGTFWQTTQPVSGTVTANAGSGTLLVDGSAHTQPVSGTFWQTTQPVSGTFWQTTQPVSGTVTANAGTNLNTSLLGLETTQTAFKSANHTDLASINTTLGSPFQAGASIGNTAFTANAGTNLNTSLLALDSTVAKDASLSTLNTSVNTLLKPANTLAAVTTLGTITNALPTGTNNIGSITNVTGTVSLPTGASTSALQTTGNTSLSSIDGKLHALGQNTMANSMPVTIASDQSYGSQTTGTLTGSQTLVVTLNGASTATVYASDGGSFSGNVNLEATVDGSNWISVNGADIFNLDGVLYLSITTGPPVLPRSLQFNVAGFKQFRARAIAVGGTLNITIGTSQAPGVISSIQNTVFVSGSVTANAGTNLNTSLLQLDATGVKLNNAQASTTASQTGPLIQGAVTTSAPTYTTAKTNPLSLNTNGGLRVDMAQGFSTASQSTPKQVMVTTTTTQLLAANTSRRYVHIINNSVSPVFMQYGSNALVGQGIKLNTGGIWTIDTATLWTGAINAIVSSGMVSIDVFEATF